MKKRYLLFLLVLLSGCNGNNPTPTPSEQPSAVPTVEPTVIPTEEPTVEPTVEINPDEFLSILENSRSFSSVRDVTSIYNGKERIYEVLSRFQYDSANKYLQHIYQENGKNDLNSASPNISISKQIYYDGEYSYSLDSDGIYIREKYEAEFSGLSNSFNYSVLKNVSISENGFRHVLTASVDDADVATLLNNAVTNITSFTFEATFNSGVLEELEFTYTQNNLSVVRNIQFTYYDIELSMPTSYRTLD